MHGYRPHSTVGIPRKAVRSAFGTKRQFRLETFDNQAPRLSRRENTDVESHVPASMSFRPACDEVSYLALSALSEYAEYMYAAYLLHDSLTIG
jgi:hypothetical protein